MKRSMSSAMALDNSPIPQFPDVPTMQKSGMKDFDISSWYGLSAATGTPPAIINRMSMEIVDAPADLDSQSYVAFINAEV